MAVHPATDNSLSDEGPAEQIDIGGVSPDFFQFIGREPFLGRSFTSGDEVRSDGSGPVIISHGLWTRRSGSDPGILGRSISISGRPGEVIGVLPANFDLVLPEDGEGSSGDGMSQVIDAWRLLSEGVFRTSRFEAALRVIGRLREGVTPSDPLTLVIVSAPPGCSHHDRQLPSGATGGPSGSTGRLAWGLTGTRLRAHRESSACKPIAQPDSSDATHERQQDSRH